MCVYRCGFGDENKVTSSWKQCQVLFFHWQCVCFVLKVVVYGVLWIQYYVYVLCLKFYVYILVIL